MNHFSKLLTIGCVIVTGLTLVTVSTFSLGAMQGQDPIARIRAHAQQNRNGVNARMLAERNQNVPMRRIVVRVLANNHHNNQGLKPIMTSNSDR